MLKDKIEKLFESLFQMDWPYYEFREGYLYDEDGNRAFDKRFTDGSEAQQYLDDNDIRGDVRWADENDEIPREVSDASAEEHKYRMENDPDYAKDHMRRRKMSPEQINMEDEDLPPGVGR